jgi:biotin synthesis protein BioG
MKFELIHNEASGRLILIFAGWSTGPSFYSHIRHEGWDVAVVHDYSDLSFPLERLDRYHTVALFAWSLGVFAARAVIPAERIALGVAVNGTESPVDDETGIPRAIYDGTLAGLDSRNLMKFRRRMCGPDYKLLQDNFRAEEDDIENLRAQLSLIGSASAMPPSSGLWDRVYISGNDLIFPPEAQQRFWQSHPDSPEIIQIDSPHYIDLLPVINSVLPASGKVGRLFHKALPTYDCEAEAQRETAERLTDFAPLTPLERVVEIGSGSGIFSRLFARKFHPGSMVFVDLYPLPHYNVAPHEDYHVAEGEDWIRNQAGSSPESYDAIVSASALQWFVNPEAFFRNAARLLKPGGILLCSTFLPGNLGELNAVGNRGLLYRSRRRLESMLGRHFSSFSTEQLERVMTFPTPRHTLMHLHHTGVGGGLQSGRPLSQLLSTFPTRLTYRPLLIYAMK